MIIDLSSILSRPASTIEAPKPMPQGLYVGQIEKALDPREINTKNGPTVVIDLMVKVLQPIDVEVPADVELPRTLRHTLWLGESQLHRTRDFLESTLKIEGGNRTLGEMLGEVQGKMLRVEVVEENYIPKGKDTPEVTNNIKGTFAID
jgi:hypothetical protein